jgi:peptide/nickel transport system substrate-binding protein
MRDLTRRDFLRAAAATTAAGAMGAVGALPRPARAAEPKRGGILKLLQIEPAVGFNPALEGTNWPETQRLIYNGLTDYGPTGELVPGLARSWTVSDDADTFTFRLTPGVTFHDGKELTAEDVRFTFESIADAKVASPMNVYIANLKSVETPDKATVTLKFNGPNVLMMPGISAIGIIPKHVWAGTDFRKNPAMSMPVGTGPFKLREWQRSSHLVFEANRNYFRKGKPYVDQVIFKVVPDAATGIEAFKNGELDVVMSQGMPGGLPYAQVRQLVESRPANIAFHEFVQNFNQNLWMNCAAPPFDNPKVRRAIAYAINKELIVKALLQGFGRVQDSYLGDLPGHKWAHDPSLRSEYSPAKANQLLDEAGLPRKGASRFAVTLLATEGFRVKLSEALKAMLAPVGIDASIKSYTWATYIARIRQDRDTAGCLWTIFSSRQVDPAFSMDYLSAKNVKAGGSNYAQWTHPRATELIEAARSTAVQEKRKALYQEIQRIVFDETAVIPLYSAIGVDMFHKHVEGLHSNDGLTGTMTSVEGVWLNK